MTRQEYVRKRKELVQLMRQVNEQEGKARADVEMVFREYVRERLEAYPDEKIDELIKCFQSLTEIGKSRRVSLLGMGGKGGILSKTR